MYSPILCRIGSSVDGGCDFAARPRLAAHDQPIFWSEAADTTVLRLAEGVPPWSRNPKSLAAFLSAEVSRSPAEVHLLFRDIGSGLHLIAESGIAPDTPVGAFIPLDADGLDRSAALDRLMRYLAGYRVPPDQRVTAQQRRRLKTMLRVCDARHHRASQREIAKVIFGVERVAQEHWKASPLRDIVRDLIADGSAMIGGGYLKLLRFRRRP